MPSHPADFREWLSGKCLITDPPAWTYKVRAQRVTMAPSWQPTVISGIVVVFLLSIIGGGTFHTVYHDRSELLSGGTILAAIVFLAVGGGLGTVFGMALKDLLKGRHLACSLPDRRISLPRDRIVVGVEDVLAWRLVSGHWVGPVGAQREVKSPMSELQLVVRTPDGPVAYVVAGGFVGALTRPARDISQATGIPLEIVEQHQGISDSTPSRLPDSWGM